MSLIVQALKAIAEHGGARVAARVDESERAWVLDYQQNFADLWDFDGVVAHAELDLVVLVESAELGGIGEVQYTRHLGASDWCLMFCRRRALLGRGLPAIVVLDARKHFTGTEDHGSGILAALKAHRGVALPVFQAAPATPGQLDKLVAWLRQPLALKAQAPALSPAQCAAIGRFWLERLSESDDRNEHHFLNNALAPLAIAAHLPRDAKAYAHVLRSEQRSSAARQALMRTLESLSFAAAHDDGRQAELPPEARTASYVLVDDQAGSGWSALLSHGLKSAGARELSQSLPDAQKLIYRLEQMVSLADSGSAGPFRFKLSLFGQANEVLILDIRLFGAGVAGAASAETEYFRRLVGTNREPGLIERLNAAGSSGDASRGIAIAHEEVLHLRRWLDESSASPSGQPASQWRSQPQYLNAVTLLARLLACLDCSYPVILFSSTGQRAIAQLLAPYPSIHTGFPKPRFGTYGSSEIAGDFWHGLAGALAFVGKLAVARARAQDLLERRLEDPPGAGKWLAGTGKPYVEVFTDESGSDDGHHFVVTALAVAYRRAVVGPDEARAANLELEGRFVEINHPERPEEVLTVPFKWRKKGPYEAYAAMPKHVPNKKSDAQWRVFRGNTARLLKSALESGDIAHIASVSLYVLKEDDARDLANPMKEFGLDGLNFKLILSALEILLTEVLSAGRLEPRFEVSFFMGNRRRYLASGMRANVFASEAAAAHASSLFRQRFGIYVQPTINEDVSETDRYALERTGVIPPFWCAAYQSISEMTPARLWAELANRSPFIGKISPRVCIGEGMNSIKGTSRTLHNLADGIASTLNSSRVAGLHGAQDADNFSWYSDGLKDTPRLDITYTRAGDALEFAIESCRCHDIGEFAGSALLALLAVQADKSKSERLPVPSALPVLLRKGSGALMQLEPRQYQTLATDLTRWSGQARAMVKHTTASRGTALAAAPAEASVPPAELPPTELPPADLSFEAIRNDQGHYCVRVNGEQLKKKPHWVGMTVNGKRYFAEAESAIQADDMRAESALVTVELTTDIAGKEGLKARLVK